MKIPKRKDASRYYKQILATLLVVNFIPAVFLGYYVYSFVNLQMKAVYKSYATELENEREKFENIFEYVDVSLTRLGLKTVCCNAVNKPQVASNFQIFNSMREELQLITSTESYLEDVYLISRDKNWILSETTFKSTEEHPSGDEISRLMEVKQSSFWQTDGRRLYVCKRVPINALSGNGMLIGEFDQDGLLKNLSAGKDGSTLFVLDRENRVMVGPEGASDLWKDVFSLETSTQTFGETTVVKLKYQDRNYAMLQSVSPYNGWKYVLMMPTEAIDTNIRQIVLMALFVILGFLVTSLAAILISSRRLYLPIDRIDSAVQKGIDYTAEGQEKPLPENIGLLDRIQYMVSKSAEMNQQLELEKKDGQQLFLRKVYQGEIPGPDPAAFEKNGFPVKKTAGGTYFVLAIKYHEQFADEKDRQLYLFALDNVVNELIDREKTFPPVVIGSLMYLTCSVETGSDESSVMKIQMLAIMIITTVKKYMQQALNIGISQGFSDLSGVTRGVEESRKALQDAMGTEGEVNFYHDHHAAGENVKGYGAKKRRVQLLHYIDLGDRENCRAELDEYLRELSGLYYYLFKLEICKLVSEILSIYSDYALTPDYDKVGDIIDFDITKTVNTADKLKDYMWEYLFAPLFDVICVQVQERDMMQQVVEYLLDNIEKDISLDECARHFNYNANYLSRWFKSKMGMTYTDFVIGKKMDMCKNLLVESDVSVNELAARFGYSSPQNFIRVFKKFTLLTPGQYRKTEREKKNQY